MKPKLSLAVMLKDKLELSGTVRGQCLVELDPKNNFIGKTVLKKNDGCFLFFNLTGNEYSLIVTGKYYQKKTVDVSLDELDIEEPVKKIDLHRGPYFPYSKWVTTISGTITDEVSGLALEGVVADISEEDLSTSSNERGRFLFVIKGFDEDITQQDIEILFRKEGYKEKTMSFQIENMEKIAERITMEKQV